MRKVGDSKTWESQVAGAAYADLGTAWDKWGLGDATISLENTDAANGANYKILGSVDGSRWHEEVAEQVLAAQATAAHHITNYWPFLKVQIKRSGASDADGVKADGAALHTA